jgi:hypothetical protein
MPASAATARRNPVRLLEQQAAAVAGLAVGGHGAAVGQAAERRNGRLDQPVARLVVHLGDQAEAAAVALVLVAIEAGVAADGGLAHGVGSRNAPAA